MPWSFVDKSRSAGNGALQGEFFEAGVDLSVLGLQGECSASVGSETRSSPSTTAELKDFILGQLGVCAPDLTTQVAGVEPNGSIAQGAAVRDTATVTVSGATSPADATGTSTSSCASMRPPSRIAHRRDALPAPTRRSSIRGARRNTTDGVSGAFSDFVNTAASPLAPGFYCFRAEADVTNYADPDEVYRCHQRVLPGD